MDVFTAIILYFCIWWTVIFTVLPWGNRATGANNDGNVASAPDQANMKKKFIITSIISLVLLAIIATLIELNVIDFRAISQMMIEEDL